MSGPATPLALWLGALSTDGESVERCYGRWVSYEAWVGLTSTNCVFRQRFSCVHKPPGYGDAVRPRAGSPRPETRKPPPPGSGLGALSR